MFYIIFDYCNNNLSLNIETRRHIMAMRMLGEYLENCWCI